MFWHSNRPRCCVDVTVVVPVDVALVVVGVVVAVKVGVVVVVGVVVADVVGVERWHSFSSNANVPSKIPPIAAFNASEVASHSSSVLASQLMLSQVTGWTASLCAVNLLMAVVRMSP